MIYLLRDLVAWLCMQPLSYRHRSVLHLSKQLGVTPRVSQYFEHRCAQVIVSPLGFPFDDWAKSWSGATTSAAAVSSRMRAFIMRSPFDDPRSSDLIIECQSRFVQRQLKLVIAQIAQDAQPVYAAAPPAV